MIQFELLSDRMKRESLQKRRDKEAERRERVFNDKMRTIGVDKEALDMQVKEKKKQQEAEKEEEQAYNANLCHNSKVAFILHSREEKKQRALEKDIVNYRLRHQQPRSQQEYELNHPDHCRKTDQEEAQMMPPGLVGLDPEMKSREQRQKEQLREWLLQQQSEQAAERHRQMLKEQRYDQTRVEMDQKAQQLQRLEMERTKAEAIATKEYNLAITERRHHQEHNRADNRHQTQGQVTDTDVQPNLGMVGVPGLFPSSDRRAPPESLQQVVEFQKYQIEERKRIEFEKKQKEKLDDNARIASARMALLIERQQAKLSKQLRQHLDSTNVQLAEARKQQKPDIERGCIDDSFFSKFNTCSR